MIRPTVGGIHVRVRNLAKRFGHTEVLRGIDLEARPGEFVTIVGKSGCGKSTLLRLIAGLETPTEGEIQVDGQILRGHNHRARMMFQEARLLPWKRVLENVRIGLERSQVALAEEALRQVGLLERAGDWPAILSGGQRQRVALARALASRPPLLLLDEPLGALDALTRIEMQQLLEQLWLEQGFTAILITHDVEEAILLGDRVVLIEDRRIPLDLPIDLPRPRRRGSPAFGALVEQLLRRVLQQTTWSTSGIPARVADHARPADHVVAARLG